MTHQKTTVDEQDSSDAIRTSAIRSIIAIDRTLLFGPALICLLIIAVVANLLLRERNDTLRFYEQSATNLRVTISSDIANFLNVGEVLLKDVVDDLTMNPRMVGHTHHEFLERVSSYIPAQAYMRVLGTNGHVVDSVGEDIPTGMSFADRDYFMAPQRDPDIGTFISAPYLSRLHEGVPTFALSRRISNPDGSFGGVALIAIELTNFEKLFSELSLGKDGAITVVKTDGRVLVRQPTEPGIDVVGLDLSSSPNFKRLLEMGTGSFTAKTRVDGVRRTLFFGPVGNRPLVVSVGLAVDEIYAIWRARAVVIATITVFICVALTALSLTLRRELRRRAIAEAHLAALATTDPLTGLANRRRFDEVIAREWRRTRRAGSSLALLMIDADHFKRLNDTYGHTHGDTVLRTLGDLIANSTRRAGDCGARYGGEEFAVVLPDATLEEAVTTAEKIRVGMENRFGEKAAGRVPGSTVSVGVAFATPETDGEVARVIEAADHALYEAKNTGRNRVVSTVEI